MKKTLLSTALLSAAFFAGATGIIPRPASQTQGEGSLVLTPQSPLTVKAPAQSASDLREFAASWRSFGTGKTPGITLDSVSSLPGLSSPEAYILEVTPKGATVKATGSAGLFYGLVTLRQLAHGGDTIPCVTVTDEPRMPYRGMMLDISRHFRDKNFILKQIDAMALLKLNNLHLHLTDAAGWRIEIDRYPELTEYAAWRPGRTWKEWNAGGNLYSHRGDSCAFGGFLTKNDAREIVEYAAKRHINVIPEIEMPSHSEEVTAAYPELSCTHSPKGQPDFCVGNEKTFEFLQNVLDEVMEIFPSKVIHIGGDEASKQAWKECELCKARMDKENLKDVDELQSYLIKRMESYLNSKGRRLLGWDEIIEGGLAPNAEVMSWRGTEGGIAAAKDGHDAIMSPGGYCYLDSYQDAPATQPEAIGGYLPLERVYSYNPVPDTLSAEIANHIKGIQGNLWCEYIPTAEHAEYMLYPRMFAVAEIGWTPQALRSYSDFLPRVKTLTSEMKARGYNAFDITTAVGNKPEAYRPEEHKGVGKKVTYNIPWWKNYPAGGKATLTDGIRGGWNYSDGLWQGYLSRGDNRMDVTVDLEEVTDITFIGAEFMQLIGPGVWMPAKVEISVSDNGTDFTPLATIDHKQEATEGVSFKEYSWSGNTKARYVRYVAKSNEGVLFTDELIIR